MRSLRSSWTPPRTSTARCLPLASSSCLTKWTAAPSTSVLPSLICEKWQKRSSPPSSGPINPKPLSSFHRFATPAIMPSGGATPANLPLPPRAPPPPPPPLSRRRSGERRLGGDSERSRRLSRRESEGERERELEGLCLRRAGSGDDEEDSLSRFSRPKRSARPMACLCLSEAGSKRGVETGRLFIDSLSIR